MAKLDESLREMAGDIPGIIAADIVGADGVSIATHSVDSKFNAEGAAAQFALAMKLLEKSARMLDIGSVEDNLLSTGKTYIVSRLLGDGSYYLLVTVDRKDANLGNVRLMARQYSDALWNAVPKRKM